MGFGIDIIVERKNGYVSIKETYLSYNWSGKQYNKYWYIRDDMDGKHSSVVISTIEKAINEMKKDGHTIEEPDPLNSSWSYGYNGDSKEKKKKLVNTIGIFMYHLTCFLDIAKKYPNGYWVTDSNYPCCINHLEYGYTTITYNNIYDTYDDTDDDTENNESTSSNKEVKTPYIFTYWHHPIKGIVKIDTFDDAMEVFGILRAKNDIRSKYWKDMAFKMKGSPNL